MKLDTDRSLVMLGEQRFPACLVICPLENYQIRPDWDRSLGGGSRFTTQAIIPSENGLLFDIESIPESPGLYTLKLSARTCEQVEQGQVDASESPWVWIPYTVSLVSGELEVGWHGPWEWRDAEPDWICEFIDYLSRKPFVQPEGPPVRLVHLNYFGECDGSEGR